MLYIQHYTDSRDYYDDLYLVFTGAGSPYGTSTSGYVKFIFGPDVKELTEDHVYIKKSSFCANCILQTPKRLNFISGAAT